MSIPMQWLALAVIGVILLIIISAFVFSAKFRQDVIAGEGEASILGLFSVKGVVIVLLIAIFCGVFIVVLQWEPKKSVEGADARHKLSLDSLINKMHIDSINNANKAKPEMCISQSKIMPYLKHYYSVDQLDDLIYIIDTGFKQRGEDFKYEVRFGEKNAEDDTIWAPSYFVFKTTNGTVTETSKFQLVKNAKWKNQYKVLMTLGHFDSLLNINLGHLIVATNKSK